MFYFFNVNVFFLDIFFRFFPITNRQFLFLIFVWIFFFSGKIGKFMRFSLEEKKCFLFLLRRKKSRRIFFFCLFVFDFCFLLWIKILRNNINR
jgi:hypothetical protein